ncbi:MAG: hypothetical protein WCE21_02695 [Candidatus Babeliales bacterium]
MKQIEALLFFNKMPEKIITLHNQDKHGAIAEFILYDLAHDKVFQLDKAAYLVDNPAFNCLKGVSGIARKEQGMKQFQDIWQEAESFNAFMKQSPFNQQVRGINTISVLADDQARQLDDIADELHLKNPVCVRWPMKYNNNGILLFEREEKLSPELQEHLADGLHVLGLCHIH